MLTIDWRRHWWKLGYATAFFAVGLPYWQIPYNKVNLPDALLGSGLVVLFAVTVLTRFYSGKSFMPVVTAMASVAPVVVLARVMVEGILDRTSHNLWPLEIIIAILVGVAAVLPGAVIGSVVRRFVRKEDGDEPVR